MFESVPELTREEAAEMMRRWTTELTGLKLMLVGMPAGSTLEDALREHRRMTQIGRRPSKVMSVDDDG